MMSLEEREVIEEASRRVGKTPAQFVKEAGLALAVSILDGELPTTRNGSGLRHDSPLRRPPIKH